jgi:hypothetical protein
LDLAHHAALAVLEDVAPGSSKRLTSFTETLAENLDDAAKR